MKMFIDFKGVWGILLILFDLDNLYKIEKCEINQIVMRNFILFPNKFTQKLQII